MEKVQAWFKAHWKPFAVAVAAGIVVWFLFMRKTSSGASVLKIPMVSGGGSAGGPGGPSGPIGGMPPTPTSATPSSGQPIGTLAGPPIGTLWDQWLGAIAPSSIVSAGRNFTQWAGDLVARYHSETGQLPAGVTQGAGFYTYSPDFLQSLYPRYQAALGSPTPQSIVPRPTPHYLPAARGSGFRGGDILPSAWGDSRPVTARAAAAANLPAAPLGTAIAPTQPTDMDVRRAPRRQTAIAQVARGNPPPSMPQSFSVPIREHLEGSRPVLTIQATNHENEDAANPPSPQTPAATQAELASGDQKATNPAPMAAATPNIARGRKRYGTQRVPARPTQRWK